MIMRSITKWCEEKEEAYIYDFENDPKKAREGSLAAFVEGLCDGALLMYVPVLLSAYYWMYKANKK